MIEIAFALTVGDNAHPGTLITIGLSETIPVTGVDDVGAWMAIKQAIERLVTEEGLPKALIQAEQFQMAAERDSRGRDDT